MRLHALVVNPALTGLEYIEWTARALPGLALIVISRARCRWPTGCAACAPAPTTGSPSRAIPRSSWPGSRRCCAAAGPVRRCPTTQTIEAGELSIRPDRFDAYAGDSPPRCRARSTSCCSSSPRPTAGCSSARTSISGCGATRWPAATARWTCSCASCARSSSGLAGLALRPHPLRGRLPVRGRGRRRHRGRRGRRRPPPDARQPRPRSARPPSTGPRPRRRPGPGRPHALTLAYP